MTEQEWLSDEDWARNSLQLFHLLTFVAPRRAERKLYLFGCACCRRVQECLNDRTRNVVRLVEGYADSGDREILNAVIVEATTEFRAVLDKALKEVPNSRSLDPGAFLEAMSPSLAQSNVAANAVVQFAMKYTASTAHSTACFCSSLLGQDSNNQVPLLRHIFGNPFRPYAAHDLWPANVIHLASALYNGEDCGFALHDALLESGYPELAQHFRDEEVHPKGCWVVDIILGKL